VSGKLGGFFALEKLVLPELRSRTLECALWGAKSGQRWQKPNKFGIFAY
jgi:hypothetical protein